MGANASHFSSQPPLDSHDAPVDVAGHVLMARFELEQEIEREVCKIDSVVTELDVCTLYASASHRWGIRTRAEARRFLSSISYDVFTDDDDGTRSDRTDGRPMKPSLERKAGRKRYQRRHRARKKGKPRKASCEHGAGAYATELVP